MLALPLHQEEHKFSSARLGSDKTLTCGQEDGDAKVTHKHPDLDGDVGDDYEKNGGL